MKVIIFLAVFLSIAFGILDYLFQTQ